MAKRIKDNSFSGSEFDYEVNGMAKVGVLPISKSKHKKSIVAESLGDIEIYVDDEHEYKVDVKHGFVSEKINKSDDKVALAYRELLKEIKAIKLNDRLGHVDYREIDPATMFLLTMKLNMLNKSDYNEELLYLYKFKSSEIRDYFIHNKQFRLMMKSGLYRYVDGFIVLNDERSITVLDNGKLKVSNLAKTFPDVYFVRKTTNFEQAVKYRSLKRKNVLKNKKINKYQKAKARILKSYGISPRGDNRLKTSIAFIEPRMVKNSKKRNIRFFGLMGNINSIGTQKINGFLRRQRRNKKTFGAVLTKLMDEYNCTKETLMEKTGIDKSTIERYRADRIKSPEFGKVVAICVAMLLNHADRDELVKYSNYNTKGLSKDDIEIYQLLLDQYDEEDTVYDFEEWLKKNGFKSLVSK